MLESDKVGTCNGKGRHGSDATVPKEKAHEGKSSAVDQSSSRVEVSVSCRDD